MNNKIIIINGPNINLLGEREQSQYGSITFEKLKENCKKKSVELNLEVDFAQSNVEGEIVNIIQESRKKFDGIIINAAAFTHTSVAIRDALDVKHNDEVSMTVEKGNLVISKGYKTCSLCNTKEVTTQISDKLLCEKCISEIKNL